MDTNEVTYFSVMHTPRALQSPGGFYEAFFSWSGPRARFAKAFWRRGGASTLSTNLPLRL